MKKKNRQNDISRGIHTKQQLLTILSCHQGPDNSCEEEEVFVTSSCVPALRLAYGPHLYPHVKTRSTDYVHTGFSVVNL